MTTKIIGSNFPDAASDQLKPSNKNYGNNQFGGASSDTPGQRTRGPLTVNHDDTDPVLAAVKSHGAKKRDIPDARPIPPSINMHDPNNPAEKVPSRPARPPTTCL